MTIEDDIQSLLPPNNLNARNQGAVPPPGEPPSYAVKQRDAINSVVDGLVADVTAKINDLRHLLDDIEQRVLESAAGTKLNLKDHVIICGRFDKEITQIRKTVEEIGAKHE